MRSSSFEAISPAGAETLFESSDSSLCWKKASEVLLAEDDSGNDAVSVMLSAADRVFASIGRYPVAMRFARGRGLLVWKAGDCDLALEAEWNGAALWTLSRGAGIGYRDRSGSGLGKDFEACLTEIERALSRSLS